MPRTPTAKPQATTGTQKRIVELEEVILRRSAQTCDWTVKVQDELTKLKHKAASTEKANELLRNDLQAAHDKLAKKNAEVQQLGEQLVSLTAEVADTKYRIPTIDALEVERKSLKQNQEELASENKELRRVLAATVAEGKEYKVMYDQVCTEKTELAHRLSTARQRLAASQTANEQLVQEKETIELERDEVSNIAEAMYAINAHLVEQIKVLKKDPVSSNNIDEKLTPQKLGDKKKKGGPQKSVRKSCTPPTDLDATLPSDVESVADSVSSHRGTLTRLNTKISQLKELTAYLSEENGTLKSDNGKLQNAIVETTEEVSALNAEMHQLKATLSQANKSKDKDKPEELPPTTLKPAEVAEITKFLHDPDDDAVVAKIAKWVLIHSGYNLTQLLKMYWVNVAGWKDMPIWDNLEKAVKQHGMQEDAVGEITNYIREKLSMGLARA